MFRLLGLLGFAALCLNATTVVAVWSPEKLVLGADSLVLTNQPGPATGCKIGREGSAYFAVIGLAEDAAAGFRAADFFFAPRFRAAAEVLLTFFTAFFRPPDAEPFRFAITRSFRTPGTSSYLDSYR